MQLLELVNEPWVFLDMSVVRDFYLTAITAIRTVSDIPIVIHGTVANITHAM